MAVCGERRTKDGIKQVKYEAARLVWEPDATSFVDMIANGTVAIDVDARTNNGRGLRNQGTKFRN